MDFTALIETCAPAHFKETIAAIIQVESSANPLSIGTKITKSDGDVFTLSRQPQTQEEAAGWAQWLLANQYQFDAGLMQINSQHFERFAMKPENIFDTCNNIKVGASILHENYKIAAKKRGEGEPALLAAVSAYNTGSFERGFTNDYVEKVKSKKLTLDKKGIMPPLIPKNSSNNQPSKLPIESPDSISSKVNTFHEGWSKPGEWKAS